MRFIARRSGLVALLLHAACATHLLAVEPDISVAVVLNEALTYEEPNHAGKTLQFDAIRTNGQWDRVWASAPSFNKGVHSGIIAKGDLQGDKLTLDLRANIGNDAWVKGGRWRGTITLQKTGADQWTGTFNADFRGTPVHGTAYATTLPTPAAIPGMSPITPDEHPRLMFRKSDLPALREKAKTPFGQAAMEKLTGVIGNSLKYQLTGDKKFAEATIPEVEKLLLDNGAGDKMVRGRILGWRFEQVALAYDMCFDVYPDDLKRRIETYITAYQGWRPFRSMSTFQKEISWAVNGTYPWPIRYGPAMAALSVYGMKGNKPAKLPASPFLFPDEPIVTVAPDKDFKPADGVPVSAFGENKTAPEWLVAGGFKALPNKNATDGFEQFANIKPKLGEEVNFNERTKPFEKYNKLYGNAITITDALKREAYTTGIFYTVIENDAPRIVRLAHDVSGRVFLNGRELRPTDIARLDKGAYHLINIGTTGQQSQWGNDLSRPNFATLTEEQAKAAIATRKADHADAMLENEYDIAQWERTGGLSIESLKLLEFSRHTMGTYFRNTIGEGGFKGASHISLEGPPKYATAYRNVFGRNVTGYSDLSMYLARAMFTFAYGDKVTLNQTFDNTQNFTASQYIERPYDTGRHLFATLFPLTDEKLKPAVLWGRQKHVGIDQPADAHEVFDDSGRITTGYPVESHVAWAFVNYPLNAAAKPPAEAMPKTMYAPTFGWAGFRNAYKDQNDFIVQAFAASRDIGPGSTQNAGAFRIQGLGQYWAIGGVERVFENVVQMPDANILETGRGRVTHTDFKPDGSGVITMDISDAYLSEKTRGLYEQINGARNDKQAVSLGIKATRSIAVDYSGKSGVPCLVVIADKISGEGTKVWAWPTQFLREGKGAKGVEGREYSSFSQEEMRKLWGATPAPAPKPAPKKDADPVEDDGSIALKDVLPVMKGNAFTVTKGSATLTGTLISPPAIKVEVKEREQFRMGAKYGMTRSTSTGVAAETKDKDVTFICVVTIGKGEHPVVLGDANAITVGGQTVRFDGEKLIIGK